MSDFEEYWEKRVQSSRVYDFQSVGVKDTDTDAEAVKQALLDNRAPIGIKTPLELGTNNDGLFKMHFNLADQIHDNFRNLVLTNHGDRLGFYDYGANLSELVHELGSAEIDNEAISRIKRSTSRYLPFISLKTFESFVDNRDNKEVAKVGLRIIYDIPNLAIKNKALEVIFRVSG